MSFLLARPQSKIDSSLRFFSSKGLKAIGLPLLKIEINESEALQKSLLTSQFEIIILTSSYAVDWYKQALSKYPLTNLSNIIFVSVGNTTASSLANLVPAESIHIATPENSEGLIALPCLQNIAGKKVAIVKGEHGRTLIHETMNEKKAITTECTVYKRVVNLPAIQAFTFEQSAIQCIISSSTEIIDVLLDNYDPIHLKTLPWIVASQRIKDYASSKGITQVFVSEGASLEALSNSALELVRTGVVND